MTSLKFNKIRRKIPLLPRRPASPEAVTGTAKKTAGKGKADEVHDQSPSDSDAKLMFEGHIVAVGIVEKIVSKLKLQAFNLFHLFCLCYCTS